MIGGGERVVEVWQDKHGNSMITENSTVQKHTVKIYTFFCKGMVRKYARGRVGVYTLKIEFFSAPSSAPKVLVDHLFLGHFHSPPFSAPSAQFFMPTSHSAPSAQNFFIAP